MESNESITVLKAVGLYVDSFKREDNHESVQRELFRFVHWCGLERPFLEIEPPEIGDYADQVAGTGTTPRAAERLQIVRQFLAYARKKGLIDRNLATHVRVRKSRTGGGKTRRAVAEEPVGLTAEGHASLLAQLEKLKSERAPLGQQIRTAAADKDVRENVPLEAAREQLGHIESRIRSIEETLRSAVIVESSKQKRMQNVGIGMRVSVKDLNSGRETQYTLVSRTEANPLEGKISDVSPLGKALIGHAAGQEVEAETPKGKIRYRIVEVSS